MTSSLGGSVIDGASKEQKKRHGCFQIDANGFTLKTETFAGRKFREEKKIGEILE